ncbi:MAG: hypothetical protein HWN66_14855 [Candidatus Helarchaeota archaeon]|nr:hypothetical protein [Candidatus Helarchaeota archaeon]
MSKEKHDFYDLNPCEMSEESVINEEDLDGPCGEFHFSDMDLCEEDLEPCDEDLERPWAGCFSCEEDLHADCGALDFSDCPICDCFCEDCDFGCEECLFCDIREEPVSC